MEAPAASGASVDDWQLVEALRQGDEAAFATLLDQYHGSMLRLAQVFVPDRAMAEEVVQDTWLGVLNGLHRFEGRASLKTWMFRILTNRAKTRRQREARSLPFSTLAEAGDEDEPAVASDRFNPAEAATWSGHWVSYPRSWDELPEEQFRTHETLAVVHKAIAALPRTQRQVITMRDIDGLSSMEVCDALEISEANQRVLLHRARSKVRRALEQHFGE
jgi:RNA polymerase sigma-70 factor (ECF subfamily)